MQGCHQTADRFLVVFLDIYFAKIGPDILVNSLLLKFCCVV